MSFCPYYLYHAPPIMAFAIWVIGLSFFLLTCVVSGILHFIKSRKARQNPIASKSGDQKYDIATVVIVGLFSAFMLWAVVAGQASRLRFEHAIAANDAIEIVEGTVSRIETVMAAPVATSKLFRRAYWTYASATIDGVVFRLGHGSPNPSFGYFDQQHPPIVYGDYLRIAHYRGRIAKIEKMCDVPVGSGTAAVFTTRHSPSS